MHVLTTGELSHLILDIRLENAEKKIREKSNTDFKMV